MQRTLETERLLLRPLALSDAEDVFEYAGDPMVSQYMPYQPHPNVEATKEWLSQIKPEDGEFAFVLKSTGKVIGAGSARINEDGRCVIGYNFNRQYWGRGYATEAAKGLISWAYTHLDARDFSACHATENTASANVLRKCGFTLDHYGRYSKFDGSKSYDAVYVSMHLDSLPY